jgi:integrase
MAKFNDASVRALSVTGQQYRHWVGDGFGVLVGARGDKTFIFKYRFGGKQRLMQLGRYPDTSLSDARIKAEEARKAIKSGVDPQEKPAEPDPADAEPETPKTVAALAAAFLEEYVKPTSSAGWAKRAERAINIDIVPAIGAMAPAEVEREHVQALLAGVVKRGARVWANRVRAVISKMFNWTIEESTGWGVKNNPCWGTRRRKEKKRRVALERHNVAAFWNAVGRSNSIRPREKMILRLILATGQRSGEVCSMAKDELDLDGERVWIIPEWKTKNRRKHLVPLSDLAISLIRSAIESSGNSPQVFPSYAPGKWKSRGAPHIRPAAISTALKESMIAAVRPHDLRRTAATCLSPICGRFMVERILNHSDPSVTDTYDLYENEMEKREALEEWGDALSEAVTTGQLRPPRRTAGHAQLRRAA